MLGHHHGDHWFHWEPPVLSFLSYLYVLNSIISRVRIWKHDPFIPHSHPDESGINIFFSPYFIIICKFLPPCLFRVITPTFCATLIVRTPIIIFLKKSTYMSMTALVFSTSLTPVLLSNITEITFQNILNIWPLLTSRCTIVTWSLKNCPYLATAFWWPNWRP